MGKVVLGRVFPSSTSVCSFRIIPTMLYTRLCLYGRPKPGNFKKPVFFLEMGCCCITNYVQLFSCLQDQLKWNYYYFISRIGDRDSPVGIATRYRLDGPGIESRRGRGFPYPSGPALGHTQPPLQWIPGLPRGKWPGPGADHPPPSKCQGHERVELYIYSPSGP